MSLPRSKASAQALVLLRERLINGVYPPETRLSAADLAAGLRLSPTPVREVLARLVGEGVLVDRRGQGVFVPRLSVRDVADLYRLSLAHLQIALETPQPSRQLEGAAGPASVVDQAVADETAAIVATDNLLAGWVNGAGGRMLGRSFRRLQIQLAPVRRVEPLQLTDLADEYRELAGRTAGPAARRLQLVRAYFRRRVRAAPRLVEALESPALTIRTLPQKDFE